MKLSPLFSKITGFSVKNTPFSMFSLTRTPYYVVFRMLMRTKSLMREEAGWVGDGGSPCRMSISRNDNVPCYLGGMLRPGHTLRCDEMGRFPAILSF